MLFLALDQLCDALAMHTGMQTRLTLSISFHPRRSYSCQSWCEPVVPNRFKLVEDSSRGRVAQMMQRRGRVRWLGLGLGFVIVTRLR
jgi:hypothetical protein